MTAASGTHDPRFAEPAELLHARVEDGTERGVSLCVIHDGEMVVDLCGSARSMARIQSVVSHGGEVDGVRPLSPGTIDRMFEVQASGIDLVLGVPATFGIGWALPEPASMPSVRPGRRCYWRGIGGSVVVNDLERRLPVAYAMNRMLLETIPSDDRQRPCGDSRSDEYLALIDEALV